MIVKLTAKNQALLWNDDIRRLRAGEDLHYSIGQHIGVLIQRMEALEAAQGIETRSAETERLSPKGESPVPKAGARKDQP